MKYIEHPLLKPNKLEARLYQELLATRAIEKGNTLIVAPTALGKTPIALMVSLFYMAQKPRKKVLFLAPTKPLVAQHLKSFEEFTHIMELDMLTGETPAPKRKQIWSDARVIFATPQCVTGETTVFSMKDGPISIRELVEKSELKKNIYGGKKGFCAEVDLQVLGFSDNRIVPVRATKVWKLPAEELVHIKTTMKKNITCTPEHPLLSINSNGEINWIKSQNIKEGTWVGIAANAETPLKKCDLFSLAKKTTLRVKNRKLITALIDLAKNKGIQNLARYSRYRYNAMPVKTFLGLAEKVEFNTPAKLLVTNKTAKSKAITLNRELTPGMCYLVGAMLGDGHIGNSKSKGLEVVFSALDHPSVMRKFEKIVKNTFGIEPKQSERKGLIYYSTALGETFHMLGVPKGKKAESIRIPTYLFFSPVEYKTAFLDGIFDTDGNATKLMIRFSTISKHFAEDLELLLVTLGFSPSIYKRKNKSRFGGKTYNSKILYTVALMGAEDISKFLSLCNPDKIKSRVVRKSMKNKKTVTRHNMIPVPDLIKSAYLEHRANGGRPLQEVRTAYLPQKTAARYIERFIPKLKSKKADILRELIQLPIQWVQVTSTERIKKKTWVYDLTVERDHNFIANRLINHNTVESAMFSNDVDLSEVALVIFDEAHRAVGDYSYVFIADQYKRKSKGRILALTASPGSTREKIQEVCGNLFIKNVEVRTEKDDDVKHYVHDKQFEWIYVELPDEYKQIKELIEETMKLSLKNLKDLGFAKNTSIRWYGRKNLLKMQQYLMKIKTKNPKSWKAISEVAALMKLHHAHELIETQGIKQLETYFEKLWKEETKASKRMRENIKMQKAKAIMEKALDGNIRHPKLEELLSVLDGTDQAIVFTHYRTSSKLVAQFLNSNGIKAKRFIGQTSKEGEKGLRQREQIDMIDEFRNGDFRVLVATSVGEEGLDIPSVDKVVFYEPVASEIRKIQRAGRTGRHHTGQVVVLVTKDTVDEAYYWASKRKEKNMKEALEELSSSPITERQQTLGSFANLDKVTIFVDQRERASGITRELMNTEGIAIKPMQLPVGDFLVSERVVVERKSAKDFVQSIIDGRLFEQAQSLVENFRNPVLLVEGEDLYSVRNVHPNAIRGALAAIAIDFHIPIIWSQGVEDSAAIITVLAKREQEERKQNVRLRGDKRAMADVEQQEFLVGGLPGVGGLLAKDLLKEFGTVEKVFSADERKLKHVVKIGPKKAKEIRRILTKKYL